MEDHGSGLAFPLYQRQMAKNQKDIVKALLSLFALLCFLVCGSALASTPASGLNAAQVRLDLIHRMQDDGFLSNKLASEAKLKYVDPKELTAPAGFKPAAASNPEEDSPWERYLSLASALKVGAVLFFLVAFWGVISNIIAGVWHLLVKVPVVVYQIPFLALSVAMTVFPALFWASQAFYIVLFGSVANLIVLGWIFVIYDKLALRLLRFMRLGMSVGTALAFWAMIYFGTLALLHQSQIFGFAAAVCLSGVLSFGMYYSSGTLWLRYEHKAEASVVFGHLLVLLAYVATRTLLPQMHAVSYFSTGLEYYCTVALCVGLLVSSSPMQPRGKPVGMYAVVFILVAIASLVGYYLLGQQVIGSMVACFFLLFCLEWLGYWGFKGGLIVGCAVLGTSIYGLSLLMEHYGQLIVLVAA
jgi:hypothetical protein